MNVKISLLCFSVCFVATISVSIPKSIDERWADFKFKFNKKYRNLSVESVHKKNFEKNVEEIYSHNAKYKRKEVSYKLGITQFADLDKYEIFALKDTKTERCDDSKTKQLKYKSISINADYPRFFDWRNNGTLSDVKDKGKCKSDYAFAAIGLLEGYLYKKTGTFTPLSEQDLIECSQYNGNNGCYGGCVRKAVNYVQDHGISFEKSYPFSEKLQKCRKVKRDRTLENQKTIARRIDSVEEPEQYMKHIISQNGPIAAKIYAPTKFFFYKKGIFTGEDCTTNTTDYNVLIVGYGKTQGVEYWIVKNWMGTGWGEKGYARIAINACGIASEVLTIGR